MGVVVLSLLAACNNNTSTSHETGEPVAMQRMDPALRQECLQASLLRGACPMLVPREPSNAVGTHAEVIDAHGADRWDVLDLGWGGADVRSPERNRPAHFLHLTIMAGELTGDVSPFPFAYPISGDTPDLRDIQLESREAVWLGEQTWRDRKGSLVLAPSFDAGGGIQGGHLIFRWSSAGVDYAAGLHAWSPLDRAVATLQRIVESIPETAD